MYQDDKEAMYQRADAATREAERLRRENEAMRNAMVVQQHVPPTFAVLPPTMVYPHLDVRSLPLPERARLAQHSLKRFPVAATIILNWLTLGIFGFFHFSLMHDRMPAAASNDPSGGKAVGFQFIPYFNLYWIFFNSRRLCDRLNLQFRLRGQPDQAPKGAMTAACIFTVIPYIGWLLGYLFMWPIAAGRLQAAVNRAAELPQGSWDPTVYGPPPR
jgi:hypothetical protein